MTRGIRIFLACAIALIVIGAGGLAVLTLFPASAPLITKSLTGGMGGPFTLTASDGRTVTDRSYRGKWLLIYFGYTNCPDACPLALNNIGLALQTLGPGAANLQPLFITVDPKRDTRDVLATYLKSFDPRIVALTGTTEQIAAIVREYHVYVDLQENGGKDSFVNHSSIFYMVNPKGKFVNIVHGAASGKELANKLRQMMKHTG